MGAEQVTSPEYLNQSRAPAIITGNVICQLLGSLFIFARLYARLLIVRSFGIEDGVLMAAWLFATGYSICQYGQVALGAGRHAATVPLQNVIEMQKYAYAAQILLFPAIALGKLSICVMYLRIFHSNRTSRILIKAIMALTILLIVPFCIEVAFQCNPVHVYWSELRPTTKCLHDQPAFYVNGALNLACDAALIAAVLPQILGLKLNRRQKLALVGIVMLGWLAVIAGIIRMVKVGAALNATTMDLTWSTYDISIWTSTEINISLVCAAAPGVKPLLARILPRFLGTTLRSRSRTREGISKGNTYELSTKRRSGTEQRSVSMTRLTGTGGLHSSASAQGGDEESLDGRIEGVLSQESGIYKRSEIVISSKVAE